MPKRNHPTPGPPSPGPGRGGPPRISSRPRARRRGRARGHDAGQEGQQPQGRPKEARLDGRGPTRRGQAGREGDLPGRRSSSTPAGTSTSMPRTPDEAGGPTKTTFDFFDTGGLSSWATGPPRGRRSASRSPPSTTWSSSSTRTRSPGASRCRSPPAPRPARRRCAARWATRSATR